MNCLRGLFSHIHSQTGMYKAVDSICVHMRTHFSQLLQYVGHIQCDAILGVVSRQGIADLKGFTIFMRLIEISLRALLPTVSTSNNHKNGVCEHVCVCVCVCACVCVCM